MNFSSILNILTVEKTESKTLDKDGKRFEHVAARVVLLNDDGSVNTVGRLRVPKALVDQVKPGMFRASFALKVPDFGDDKGDVVSVLTGLVEQQTRRGAAAAA